MGYSTDINNKESISATKSIYKTATICTYQTLPNLNLFVLKQGQTTQRTKSNQPKYHESTSFKMENKCMVHTKMHTQGKYLPQYYNDNM